jgi:DNA-binding transcriptional LysR family regulator
MSNINLIYLKYFCDAVKYGSISASAKVNCVSQSAISQGIAKLEQSLKKELIMHHPNRFKLTHEGHLVFEKGKEIFKELLELEESLIGDSESASGHINFACMHSIALGLIPRQLKELQRLYPKIQVNFRLGHTDLIKEWLKKGIIDFGICLDNDDLSAFDCHQIHEGEYLLYVSKKCKNPEKLLFLLSEDLPETNFLRSNYQKKYKKELPVLMEVSSWEVIASLTEEGMGVGFFPDYVAARRLKELRSYNLGLPRLPYKVHAIFSKKMKRSKVANLFLGLFS